MTDTTQSAYTPKQQNFAKPLMWASSLFGKLHHQREQRLTQVQLELFTERQLEDLGLARRDIDSSIGRN